MRPVFFAALLLAVTACDTGVGVEQDAYDLLIAGDPELARLKASLMVQLAR